MRTSTIVLTATAALVRAIPQTPGDDVPINCAQANANYCMAEDIILRCDENAIGTPARCSPNLSGYPPAGGVASCWESSNEAGDAACQKNCVVYPEPPDAAFTLPSDECTPSHSDSETTPGPTHPPPNSTITTSVTTTVTHTDCEYECTETPSPTETHPPPPPPDTETHPIVTDTHPPVPLPTVPTGTNATWVPTETYVPPPPPSTDVPPPPPPPGTDVPPPPPPPGTDVPPPPPPPGTDVPPPPPSVTEEPTNVPVPPTTTPVEPVPTGAATANKVGTLLGAAGFFIALML